jgi:hypothetical protein
MALAVRAGAGALLPDRVLVDNGGASAPTGVSTYLSGALGRDLEVCLYIGPPRAVQKPIVQLISREGETVAFAKVGTTSLTRALVKAEGAALERLAQAGLSAVEIPRVLHRGCWEGHDVLVVAAVTGTPRGRLDRRRLIAAEAELAAVGGAVRQVLWRSAYWTRLADRLVALPDSALAKGVLDAWQRLDGVARRVVVAFGSWHGDWTPWNMTTTADGIVAWDWEQFGSGVPVGFDTVHFAVQRGVVFDGAEPHDAFIGVMSQAVDLFAGLPVAPGSARLVVLLYLMEIAVRYLHDGEVELDATRMGRLYGWLLPTLELLLLAVEAELTR